MHSHALLVQLLPVLEDAATASAIVATLNAHLTVAHIAAECAALAAGLLETELPYGFAWTLALVRHVAALPRLAASSETAIWAPHVEQWIAALRPLEQAVVTRLTRWCADHSEPNRCGQHGNAAFALSLLWRYARTAGPVNGELTALVAATADRRFGRDRALCEPDIGFNFLSPLLTELVVMLDVHGEGDQFSVVMAWLQQAVSPIDGPLVAAPEQLWAAWRAILARAAEPVEGDARLPQESHRIGLNLSRAWGLRRFAVFLERMQTEASRKVLDQAAVSTSLGDLAAWLRASAQELIRHALPHVACGHWMGDHWTATFAALATEE